MEQLKSTPYNTIQIRKCQKLENKQLLFCPYFDFPDLTYPPQAQESLIAKTPNNGADRDCDK